MAAYQEITLPNSMTVFCLHKSEAKLIYRDIPTYFRHGIEVGSGDTVFDVGANIGLFTLSVYERCGQDVNVYAFEPIQPVFNILRLNTERFDPDKLKAFSVGLSRERKTMTFTYFPLATAWSSAFRDNASLRWEQDRNERSIFAAIEEGRFPWLRLLPSSIRSLLLHVGMKKVFETGKKVDCEVRTVSEIIHEYDIRCIDLLKVDVEKSELDVLMGIKDHDWQKIKQVVVEVEDFSRQSETVVGLLDKQGFKQIKLEQDNIQRVGDYGMVYARRC